MHVPHNLERRPLPKLQFLEMQHRFREPHLIPHGYFCRKRQFLASYLYNYNKALTKPPTHLLARHIFIDRS